MRDFRERSAGIIHRSLRWPGFKERSESGLPKMMIRGKSIANTELAHDSETDAIGKGPLFGAMLAKPCYPQRDERARGIGSPRRADPPSVYRIIPRSLVSRNWMISVISSVSGNSLRIASMAWRVLYLER